MEKLHGSHGWCASSYRCTMVVCIALLTFTTGEVRDVRAAWISLPFSPKSEAASAKPRYRVVSSVGRRSKNRVIQVGSESAETSTSTVPPSPQVGDEERSFAVPPQPEKQKRTEDQAVDTAFDQEEVTAPEKQSEIDSDQEAEVPAKSNQMKLRPRFETDEPILATLPEDRGTVSKRAEPTITPKSKAPTERKVNREPGRIVENSQETVIESKTASVDHDTSEEWPTGEESDDAQSSDFPKEKVIALKRKMESAIALNPGEVVGSLTTEPVASPSWDQTPEEKKVEVRRVRLRKHQRRKPIDHSNLAEEIGKSRQPMIGYATMVQWRSATSDEKTAIASEKFESRSTELMQDLRQALREGSKSARDVSTISKEPTLDSHRNSDVARSGRADQIANSTRSRNTLNRTQLRGSLWDNASAPSDSDYSGTIGGTGKMMDSRSVDLGYAPKPPSDPMVEQVSFDKPAELFSRRSSAKESTRAASDQDEQHIASAKEDSDRGQIKIHETRSDVTSVKGPFAWISYLFGFPASTGSMVFTMTGAALCVAGIWFVRETIRSKNS